MNFFKNAGEEGYHITLEDLVAYAVVDYAKKVEMSDSEGIMITSDKNIVFEAKENLTIVSNSASLLIAAEDVLQVRQGGTSMTLSEDIAFTGGEFRIQ